MCSARSEGTVYLKQKQLAFLSGRNKSAYPNASGWEIALTCAEMILAWILCAQPTPIVFWEAFPQTC